MREATGHSDVDKELRSRCELTYKYIVCEDCVFFRKPKKKPRWKHIPCDRCRVMTCDKLDPAYFYQGKNKYKDEYKKKLEELLSKAKQEKEDRKIKEYEKQMGSMLIGERSEG